MRILVTGGTGQVGSNVIKLARDKHAHTVIATIAGREPEVPWNVETVHMNLEDDESIRAVIRGTKPDAVIHCAVPRDLDRLEMDHDWSWRVMVTGTETMVRATGEIGAKMVFVSTDWVFGVGGNPPYSEDSPPSPVNYYAVLKVVGETLVRTLSDNGAVARVSGVYGPNWSFPSAELTEEYAQENVGFGRLPAHVVCRLSRGLPVVVWTKNVNYLANPSLASDIAGCLLTICEKDQRGIFHCGGRDSIDRLEYTEAVAEAFGYDQNLIRLAEEGETGALTRPDEVRVPPRDTRLSVAKTEERLGRVNMGVRQGLQQYKRELQEMGKL